MEKLSNVFSQNTRRDRNTQRTTMPTSFTGFLTVFTHLLSQRYPEIILDLDVVNREDIVSIARFAVACTPIALEVWDELRVQGEGEERKAA